MSKAHVVVVPKRGGAPVSKEYETVESMLAELHGLLLTEKEGWCYAFVDGQPCLLSDPIQSFKLKTPDGKEHVVASGNCSYNADKCFRSLTPYVPDDDV